MKRKIAVCLLIFTLLFVGSWWLHEDLKPVYHFPQVDDEFHTEVQLLRIDSEADVHPSFRYYGEPFRPREYVRIYPRTQRQR